MLVIVLDAAKGAIAGFVGLAIGDAAAYAAGTAAIAGHCWPVWNGFRGGKGWPTAGGSFFVGVPADLPDRRSVRPLVVALIRRTRGWRSWSCSSSGWSAAAVWWAADLPMWWGPGRAAGLLVYAVLGAVMVLARFPDRSVRWPVPGSLPEADRAVQRVIQERGSWRMQLRWDTR